MILSRLLAVAATLCVGPAFTHASAPASSGFRLLDTVNTGFSYTADADLRRGAGELSVWRYELDASGRTALSPDATLTHGIGFVRTELDRPEASLLPETLQELSLRLGWQYRRDANWRFIASVRPGFFGDGRAVEADTFNAPFLGLASYAASRELIWSFGLIANAFSDNPVLPIAGLRWEFAPAWRFDLGFPRAGVAWELNRTTTLTAGATFQGGTYRLTRAPGSSPAARSLADAKLDYREIRLGVGGTVALSAGLKLTIDVGMTVDQRFDYHELGFEQRGDPAAFAAVALGGRF